MGNLNSAKSFKEILISRLKDKTLLKTQAFVDGNWCSGKSVFAVSNPSTLTKIVDVPDLDLEDLKSAIDRAYSKFNQDFKTSSAKLRHDLLKELDRQIKLNADDLALILAAESGKPIKEARGEVLYATSFIEWFSEETCRTYGETIPGPSNNTRFVTIRQPVGVCGIITPWNFPLAMITRKLGAAVAAGCTCVIKPAFETPLSALALAELSIRSGFEPGVVNILTTRQSQLFGKELCENNKISKISFTGSTNVGKTLMQLSASTIKKVSMELGGNASFIVFDDADIDSAVNGAILAKFRNAGQTCVCPNRFYVHENIFDQFVSKLKEKVEKLVTGNSFENENVEIGPLISKNAVKKVSDLVTDAVRNGAQTICGGKVKDEVYYLPTILTNTKIDSEIVKQEIFGPVISIIKFSSDKQVVEYSNSSEHGLVNYFYTTNINKAWEISSQLESGMVAINTFSVSFACAPFGGIKESGIGREGSKHGINEYTELKFIAFGK